jgi:hypothetical protein
MQLIRYFLSRSCEVHLLCHSCTWGNRFDPDAIDLDIKAHLLHFPSWGHRIDTVWKRFFKLREHSIISKLAYRQVLMRLAPDIVLMNYASSMYLLPERWQATVIVDTHDFLSFSRYLSRRARTLLVEEKYEFSPLQFTVEAFLRDAADEAPLEFAALGQSDLILAISEHEGQIFHKQTGRAVQVLNYSAEEPEAPAPACLSQLGIMPVGTGENPHNILGAHCLDKAMRCLNPTSPVVRAVGQAAQEIQLGSWCDRLGHVADYMGAVRNYNFGVCPAFWGTGAQIKQYEFAELGMPIAAYRWMVDPDLWVDGENCMLVEHPTAFAERLCAAVSSPKLSAGLREGAKLLKRRIADRLAQQCLKLDEYLGLRAAGSLAS